MRVKNHIYFCLIALFTLFLQGCELDTCKNVECANNGVCLDGVCDCDGPYSGDNCDLENPFSFQLSESEIKVIRGFDQPVTVSLINSSLDLPMVSFSVENAPSGFDFGFSKTSISSGSSILSVTATNSAVNGDYTIDVVGTSASGIRSVQKLSIGLGNVVYDVSLSSSENSFKVYREDDYQEEYYFNLNWNDGPEQPISFNLLGAPDGTDASFSPTSASTTSSCILSLNTTADIGQYPCQIVATLPNAESISLSFDLLVLPSRKCDDDLANNVVELDLNCQGWNPTPFSSWIGEGWNDIAEVRLGKPYGSNSGEITATLDCENRTVDIPSQTVSHGSFDRTYEGSGTFNASKTQITVTYTIVTPIFGGTDYDQCTAVYTH